MTVAVNPAQTGEPLFYLADEHAHPEGYSTSLGFWIYLMSDCLIFAILFATFGVLGSNYAAGPAPKDLFDLSLVAVIAIILLIGIVKKNAIIMIDFALDAERTQGLRPEQAIFEASLKRFRPIMMTTMAALLGSIPLALGTGPGSELRRPLGIAIIGGLLLSQFLTLYTTPVIYVALDRVRALLRDRMRMTQEAAE